MGRLMSFFCLWKPRFPSVVDEVVSPPVSVFVAFIGSEVTIVGCVDFWVLYWCARLSVGPMLFYIAL